MKTSRNEPAVHSEIRAALRSLEAALKDGIAAQPLVALLASVGDALRAEIDLPPAVRAWMRALDERELGGALDAQRGEVREWRVPTQAGGHDERLVSTVRRRDEAESVRLAAARAALAHRVVPASIPGFRELGEALSAFDRELAAAVSRGRIEDVLGDRAALIDVRGWTSRLPEPEAANPQDWSILESVRVTESESLSDDAILAWISEGRLARLVESRASTDPKLQASLVETIDELRLHREPVSLVARRWGKRTRYEVRPAVPLAAAGPANRLPVVARTDTDLGRLSPIAARARLLCTAHEATLQVYAEPGTVRCARFGGKEATSPDADGSWRVQIPLGDAPIDLRVTSAEGEEFSATLVIAPGPPEEEP